jgi:hypothetical protein
MNRDEWHKQTFDKTIWPLCQKWLKLLSLEHWDIEFRVAGVINDDPDIDAHCLVHTADGHRAIITFADQSLERDEQRCEESVIHELLHIILDEQAQYAYHKMPGAACDWYTRLVETAVSDLARLFMALDRRGHEGN